MDSDNEDSSPDVISVIKAGFDDMSEKLKSHGEILLRHSNALQSFSDGFNKMKQDVEQVKEDTVSVKKNAESNTKEIVDLKATKEEMISSLHDLRRREGRRLAYFPFLFIPGMTGSP